MAVINALFKSANGPTRFQNCDLAKNLSPSELDMANILEAVETGFECSGWCDKPWRPYYSFSNINNGKPKTTCYATMKDKLNHYGSVIGISSFIAAAFMMLVCICGLCVCCAPENRNQPMRSRFIVDDGGRYRPV